MSRPVLLVVLCFSLLAGCGEEPDDPPPIFEVKTPRGSEAADFPDAGMSFTRPANWRLRRPDDPAVFELVSGEAVVAGWAYRRDEPLPESDAELEGARERLLEAIEERDPDYRIEATDVRDIAGAPAIDITGEQVVARRRLRTRSVHVFEGEFEYVIEALAPPADYDLVDRRVLTPLLDSLELDGEATEDAG